MVACTFDRKEAVAMLPRCLSLVLAFVLLALPAFAQEEEAGSPNPGDADATHDELRALRDGIVRAINEREIDAVLPYLHPEIVVTWQNAEVSRGHDGVREYYQRMMEGPARIVSNFEFAVKAEELTILHGDDTGIAFGNSTEKFELARGLTFEHRGRWSATLVKDDGRWLLAGFHASTNLFDNPLLALVRKTRLWVGIVAFLVGTLLGWLVLGRRKRAAA